MTFVRRNATETATEIRTGERLGTGAEQNEAGEMATYQLNLKSSCKEAGRCVRGRAAAVDEMRVRQSDNNKNNCKNNGNIKAKKCQKEKLLSGCRRFYTLGGFVSILFRLLI